jgi:hypothetical protein
MLPFNKPVGQISEADLNSLISNAVRESKTVEYKAALPGNRDEDKKEFLADVSSFANTSGGMIIYGMAEVDGAASRLPGLVGIDPDAEILRLENSIRDGVDPRIPGVISLPIKLANDNNVIVISIPNSWVSPHMVTYQNTSRFYARNSAGKYQLDVQEIKQAFLLSDEISKRIRDFRVERIAQIAAGETPVPLAEGAAVVIHSIPISAFETVSQIDVPQNSADALSLGTIEQDVSDYQYNIDGLVNYLTRHENDFVSYLQLYRNGIIEIADVSVLRERGELGKLIPSKWFEEVVIDCCGRVVSNQRKMGLRGPIYIFFTLVNVKGYYLGVDQRLRYMTTWGDKPLSVDRNMVFYPEITIEDEISDWPRTLRPLFDMVWNSAGWPGCMDYDQDGKWNPR